MEREFTYRGKTYSKKDIDFIRKLISDNPDDSRWALSRKLCVAWNWVQKNGALRDQVCRSFMLKLDREGYITLPAQKRKILNPLANRCKPKKIEIDQTPIEGSLSTIKPVKIYEVRGKQEKLCNSLIEQYHYLGYCHPVGEHLKYIVYAYKRPVACMTWSSAPRHIGCRDRYIGWSQSDRKINLHYLAYNSRFLILPWVKIKFFASHLLGSIAKQISEDWQRRYHHKIYYLETFIDKERFSGICYRAANWIYLGDTTGRGKNDHTHKVNRSIKAVYGYPLSKNLQKKLCEKKSNIQR